MGAPEVMRDESVLHASSHASSHAYVPVLKFGVARGWVCALRPTSAV